MVLVRQHIPGMGGDSLCAVDTRETYAPFTLRNGSDPMNYPFSSRLREERAMVRHYSALIILETYDRRVAPQ